MATRFAPRLGSSNGLCRWIASLCVVLWVGCATSDRPDVQPTTLQRSVRAPDGDLTVTGLQSINRYARVVADIAQGATTLQIEPSDLGGLGLAPGDLLMIWQAQGATLRNTPTDKLDGQVLSLGRAGQVEFVRVRAVDTGSSTVTLVSDCGGTKNSYDQTGKTQIVRVPQHDLVQIGTGTGSVGSSVLVPGITWDGERGGVVALWARQVIIKSDGVVRASGSGFRGGAATPASTGKGAGADIADFSSLSPDDGGKKGEGVGGESLRVGRGALGSGGGGGNTYGAGGGGGGGTAGGGTAWSGLGVMTTRLPPDALAWALDPEAQAGLSASMGGGRGGYSQAVIDLDATLPSGAPGLLEWGGHRRRERGGHGGQPQPASAAERIFFGGGGGAGDRISPSLALGKEGEGGRGGGLVFLIAETIDGSGLVEANGEGGRDTLGAATGGGGGGGGGGSIVLNAGVVSGTLRLRAQGGAGGSQLRATPALAFAAALGPGGGGGGGLIAVPRRTALSIQQSTSGGLGGSTQADIVAEFSQNGATDGQAGVVGAPVVPDGAVSPVCACVDLSATAVSNAPLAKIGQSVTFIVTFENNGPQTARLAPVKATVSSGAVITEWTCAVVPALVTDPDTRCLLAAGIGSVSSAVTLAPGARAYLVLQAHVLSSQDGPVTLSASIAPPTDAREKASQDNAATAVIDVSPRTDLALYVQAAPTAPRSGQPITVLLTAQNQGPSLAEQVAVVVDLPANATLLANAPPTGFGWTCAFDAGRAQVRCTRDQLAVEETYVLSLPIQPAYDATELAVSAVLSAAQPDPDLTNNQGTIVVPIVYDPAGVRKPTISGGGLGCSLARAASSPAHPPGVFVALLLACALPLGLRRLRVQRNAHRPT